MIAKPLINDFTGGEVSSTIEGKVDAEAYHKTCRILENFIPLVNGGAERRPGSYYVAAAKYADKTCRLIDFPTSLASGNYILEFSNTFIRVYKGLDHSYLGEIVASPYLWADLFQIKYDQFENTMYLAHPAHKPQKLVCTGPLIGDWALTEPGFGTPPWSDVTDYPSSVCFFEQKLCFSRGRTKWFSNPGDYEDFSAANVITFVTTAKHEILWLVDTDVVNFGTRGAEWTFHCPGGPISKTSLNLLRRRTTNGVANLQAMLANDVVIYVQKGAKRIREFLYSEERKGYLSPDLTYLASHITGTGTIVGMAFQQSPDSIIWAWTSTGMLLSLTYQKIYGVMAWARHPIDGAVESVAVIPGSTEDEIWISVKRNTYGTDARHIEYFMPRDFGADQKDCFFVDCGLTWTGQPAQKITGATAADPVVVTIVGHSFSNDQIVKIEHVAGMVELNNEYYMVKNAGADDFQLYHEDGTDGVDGTFFYMDIASDPAPADFAAGATLTGAVSGSTCEVVEKITSTRYLCRIRSAAFTDGENISDGTNTATGAVGYPVIDDVYDTFVASVTGDVTNDTYWITSVSVADIAKVAVGMWVSGTGIQTGSVITEVDIPNLKFEISKEAQKTGTDVTVSLGGTAIQVSKTMTAAHLEGEIVQVLADGAAHPDCTVDTTEFTLLRYANKVHYGLPYVSKLKPQRIAGSPTAKKRIHEVLLRFNKSLGCKIGPDKDHLDIVYFRKATDPMDTPPLLYTGDHSIPFAGNYSRNGDILIVQDEPLPLTLLAIMPQLGIYE